MSRWDAARFRREQMKTRSTLIPMPPNPTVDVEGIERPAPLHGYSSIFKGAIVTFGVVVVMVGIGLIAVSCS